MTSPIPLLEIRRPDGSSDSVPLEKSLVRIGRADDNDIVLQHLSVSRWHASISRDAAGPAVLEDLKSANGVLLNGERVSSPAVLKPGDCIEVGQFQLIIREAETRDEKFSIQTAAVDLAQLQQNPRLLGSDTPDASSQVGSLELLYEVGLSLAKSHTVEEVTSLAVQLLFRIEKVSRAAVLLWDEEKNAFEDSAIHLRSGNSSHKWSGEYHPQHLVMSRTILKRVRQENRPLLIRDAKGDAALMNAASVMNVGIQAAFCSPLFCQGRFLGVLYADNLVERDAFSDTDFRTFTAVAAQTGLALGNAVANKELIRREVHRQALKAYLPPQVADLILSSDAAPSLAGTTQEITVLFADIRNFTPMSEDMEARQVVELLNIFFTRMSAIIFASGGTVDKFIGDCIMALFGAPLPCNNSSGQALAAAFEMQKSAAQLRLASGKQLGIGIGLHTGSAVVGNIGSAERVQYTAIGDTVNVAARLVSLAQPGQILFSEACKNALSTPIDATPLGEVELKGRRRKLNLYAAR